MSLSELPRFPLEPAKKTGALWGSSHLPDLDFDLSTHPAGPIFFVELSVPWGGLLISIPRQKKSCLEKEDGELLLYLL